MLCYLEGLSRDEAALRLGTTLNTVRNRLESGRSRLRTRLARRGIGLSAGLLAALTGNTGAAVPPSLFRRTIAAAAKPSARVSALVEPAVRLGALKFVGGLTLAAALLVGISIGDGRVRAGANPKDPPSKKSPAKETVQEKQPLQVESKPEDLAVKGRVIDPDGKPAKGAKVWLLLEPWTLHRPAKGPTVMAITDADGAFTFRASGAGRRRYWSEGAQVIATAQGFGIAWTGAQEDKPLELKLVKDEAIAGRILDLQGMPVPGAKVRVLEVTACRDRDLSPWLDELKAKKLPIQAVHNKHFSHEGRLFPNGHSVPGQSASYIADADGRFRIVGLGRERKITLCIEGKTIATTQETVLTRVMPALTVPEDPGDSRYGIRTFHGAAFDFIAESTQPFEGTVTDRVTGKPVTGVTVRGRIKWYETSTVTDKDGKYRLIGLAPGMHELMACPTAEQPYHRMAVRGGSKASTNTAQVDFALTRGHWVTGKLIDIRNHKPAAGAPIWYFPLADEDAYTSVPGSRAWSTDPTTYTAEDGSFRVLAFPCRGAIMANGNGQYIGADQRPLQGDVDSLNADRLNAPFLPTSPAAYRGSYHAAAIINVDPMKPKSYTITLDPGATVTVKLVDGDGKPVEGAGIGGQSTWSLWAPNQKAVMEIVQFNLDRPRPLLFLHADRKLGKLLQPKKGDAGPWTVTLETTATVTGRLVTADGAPIGQAVLQIYYRLPGQDAWTPSFAHQDVHTDKNGVFTLANFVGDVDYSFRYTAEKNGNRTVLR